MSEVSDSNPPLECRRCGAALPAAETAGLCPKCLMAEAMSPPDSAARGPHGGTPSPKPSEIAPHFPQLEILDCLGRGGMGVVYKARQPQLDRHVALKLLLPGGDGDAEFATRFRREARALARLNHPNIVTIFDFGEAGGFFYLVMEFVDGVNLRQLQQSQQLEPREALAIVPKLCEALQFAHDEGVVHRDIKPENILVDSRGRVKIADFGLARLLESDEAMPAPTLTQTRQIMGTPQYMAPEQLEATRAVDHRADIYSLGVVFYELLTGSLPRGRFDPPSKMVGIDVRLDEIVLRALEHEPERRYQHASEMKTAVEHVGAGEAAPARREEHAAAPPVPTAETAASAPSALSRKAVAGGVLAAVTVAIALFALFAHLSHDAQPRPEAMIGLLVAAGVAALGASLFGVFAAGDIRRSRDALEGWPLAVVAASALPLLLVDLAILGFVVMVVLEFAPPPGSEVPARFRHDQITRGVIASIPVAVIVNGFLVFRALRKRPEASEAG